MNENGTTEQTTAELQQQIWRLHQHIHLQNVLLGLEPHNLVETNRRLNRRCQALEHQSHQLNHWKLVATNRRLNRRCQLLESAATALPKKLNSAIQSLSFEGFRAAAYANKLREIYQRHNQVYRCYGCWWCKLKWRVKHALWRIWQIK